MKSKPTTTSKNASPIRLGATLDFMRLVWALNHSLETTSKRMEATLGLTAPQRMVVRIVGRYPGIAPGRLATILQVHPATLSIGLKRLEGRGLISRTPDPNDHRRVLLSLTPAGKAFDAPSAISVESAIRRALSTLTKAEVSAARTVLQTLVDEMASQNAEGTSEDEG